MTASRVLGLVRELLPLALAAGVLLAAMAFSSAALAAEGFGVEPGSLVAGTFTSEGATGPLGEGATPDEQAGDHPYEQTVTFKMNTMIDAHGLRVPVGGDARDAVIELPPGFVGDPNATPRCPQTTLEDTEVCPNSSVVGVAHVTTDIDGEQDKTFFLPVYNMVPSRGELVLLVFRVKAPLFLTVLIHIHVRSASDYGLTATISNISQIGVPMESAVTLWGVPANSSHDPYRGSAGAGGCLEQEGGSTGSCSSGVPPRPFLANPTQCDGSPLTSTLSVDSWEDPAPRNPDGSPDLSDVEAPAWQHATSAQAPLSGCEELLFNPSLSVTPETSTVDTPTGVQVDLHVPQSEDPYGLATPDLRDATVTLPAGMAISPSAANGLEGCTPEEIGLHDESPVSCPGGSKLGTVQVTSPDLPENTNGSQGELTGAVYLGAPASGPITAPPYTIYLVAEGYGVSIRLQGIVSANADDGQLTTTFDENPPLPFEDLKLDFFGGPRAPLMTPPGCGTYTTTSRIVPYSSPVAATPSSSFASGGSCPATLPFGPSFDAGSTNTTAGGFGSFVLNITRPDGEQAFSQISLTMPPGLLGMLSSVPLCGEAEANAGACPESSKIGTATAGAGAGSEPFYVSGPVYLTGSYKGAPFGLSVAIPAVAGPFNFGTVIVRSAIYVNPQTARITVVSDPLPQMVDTSQTDSGVPVALQSVSVDIDRPGFIFNPTSCEPMSVDGTLSSNQGASVAVSSPFKAQDCQSLAFKPSFAVSTQAKTSKVYGASLTVKVASGPGQANIGKVDVSLPKQLPSRLTTLQKACTEAQFAVNPAGCPAGSVVGVAKAVTPVLNVPLTGPAILVSHGGAAFPDLVMVLQGQGVTIELVGNTDIKNGITYSKFETVPDAPVSTFELTLPESPHSILGTDIPTSANYDLCGQSLSMPTTITGQNGAVVKQATTIAIEGCGKSDTKALTRAQKLTKALKVCKRQPRTKRAPCDRAARVKYGPRARKSNRRDS
jgi:hypothetical protein